MPVIKYDDRGRESRSPSLPHEDRSKRTPSPSANAGPSKKPRLTTTDIQKMQASRTDICQLERLLANPEKEIKIPDGPQERQMRAPRDMMKNVTGSSSGAGSGEFHVYKQSRRREYERIKIMEEKARALEEQANFRERQAARDAVTDAKTSKNRARRQKRKAGRKGEGGGGGGEGGAGPAADSHSKLAGGGGAAVVFKRPGEEASDDEEDEGEVGPVPTAAEPEVPVAPAVPVVAAVEVAITLHDDD
ncbi:PRKR-interacting protein 1 [Vanrija pseudolonga]|uniref:PRKR-interacting protein 1 n=1 Tax=Vanrija pseudolonga TaxID=143232 RepID=A0AAF0YCX7_9TREE|nr:PRKR-interacting protein 1 [Vanrija pseudolonga]